MNRRIVNQMILERTLADAQTPGLSGLIESLRMILSHNMLPSARAETLSEKDAENLASAAAQIGVDRIAAGRMYQDSSPYEKLLLQEAARHGYRGDQKNRELARRRPAGPAATTRWRDWPAWLTALYYLFLLTRRSWTYLSLYSARGRRKAWLGNLSEIYLGARTRQAGLSRAKKPLLALINEINHAWTEVQFGMIETPSGAWLQRRLVELGTDEEPQDKHRYDRFANPLLTALHNNSEEHSCSNYPALQQAFRALTAMTGSAAPLLAALAELVPGMEGNGFPHNGDLRSWLDGVPAQPAGDLPPIDVLEAIGMVPRVAPVVKAARVAAVQDDSLLFEELLEDSAPGSFEQAVLVYTSQHSNREQVFAALRRDFPTGEAVDAETAQAVASRLGTWVRLVAQTEQGRLPAYSEHYVWMEIPSEVRNSPALARARERLEDGVGWQPAAIAALHSLTLDQFACEMAAIRRRNRLNPTEQTL